MVRRLDNSKIMVSRFLNCFLQKLRGENEFVATLDEFVLLYSIHVRKILQVDNAVLQVVHL